MADGVVASPPNGPPSSACAGKFKNDTTKNAAVMARQRFRTRSDFAPATGSSEARTKRHRMPMRRETDSIENVFRGPSVVHEAEKIDSSKGAMPW